MVRQENRQERGELAADERVDPDGGADVEGGLEVSQTAQVPPPHSGAGGPARVYAVVAVSVRKDVRDQAERPGPRRAEVLLIAHSSSMVSPPSRLGAARAAALTALERIPD